MLTDKELLLRSFLEDEDESPEIPLGDPDDAELLEDEEDDKDKDDDDTEDAWTGGE
ncbi:MAG: hypothetical protein Q8P39_01445 [Candidatus Yanofskybacteria bacterium]|nr:hypothetical protein [Candidatus Yanofskybacteria bacterium]